MGVCVCVSLSFSIMLRLYTQFVDKADQFSEGEEGRQEPRSCANSAPSLLAVEGFELWPKQDQGGSEREERNEIREKERGREREKGEREREVLIRVLKERVDE